MSPFPVIASVPTPGLLGGVVSDAWAGLWLPLIIALPVAYLIGAIPFGLLIGRWVRSVDIREHGSGNIGATNAGRVLGRAWGITCFLLDMGKGLVPTLAFGLLTGLAGRGLLEPSTEPPVAQVLAAGAWLAVAVAAFLGHVFPIYLGFKGGKGIAVGLGILLGTFPLLTLAGVFALVAWLIMINRTGWVSLSSIAAAWLLAPAAAGSAIALGRPPGVAILYAGAMLVLALTVTVKHRSNIARLRAGTEPRVTWAGYRPSLPG